MVEAINGGEAADLRERMRTMENRQASFERQIEVKVSVHEARCSFRFGLLVCGMVISIGINLPAAWPHLVALITAVD
jgi:hypothetical protein